jgi:hypothetical protein
MKEYGPYRVGKILGGAIYKGFRLNTGLPNRPMWKTVGFWEAAVFFFGDASAGPFRFLSMALFTSHANPKYFLFLSSHQIFGRMNGVLNIGKKITNC